MDGNRVRYIDVIKNIYRQCGWGGFFNASSIAITSQIVSTTSKYTIYDGLKRYFKTSDGDWVVNSALGGVSGIGGIIFTQPIDRIKILRQYLDGMGSRTYSSIFKQLRSNPLDAYKGGLASSAKSMFLYSLLYSTYDKTKTKTDNKIISAMGTSLAITTLMQPIEFIRTRIMLNETWKPWHLGWKPTIYYSGFILTAGKAMPHFAITMYLTEMFKSYI